MKEKYVEFEVHASRGLHRRLAQIAQRQGVTLSDLCTTLLEEHFADRPIAVPPGLDTGIQTAVEVLIRAGIETFESCEGGQGHSYAEPTVRFHGERPEGFKALSAVMYDGRLKAQSLRRIWPVIDGEPVGPYWELVFFKAEPVKPEPGGEK